MLRKRVLILSNIGSIEHYREGQGAVIRRIYITKVEDVCSIQHTTA